MIWKRSNGRKILGLLAIFLGAVLLIAMLFPGTTLLRNPDTEILENLPF